MTKVRELSNWIDGFLEFTEKKNAPEHFRRWCAYAAIGGVAERRVWTWIMDFQCFPSLYILLMARPGIGKSTLIKVVEKLWAKCPKVRVGPSGMTKAALLDHITEEAHELFYNGSSYRYFPLCLASDEFGILLPEHNLEILNVFNKLYDADEGMSDRTRKDGLLVAEKPFLVLLAGTQPDYLGKILPPEAFGMGFTSRIIMVHSTEWEREKQKLFRRLEHPEILEGKLIHDLKMMQKVVGEFVPSKEGEEWIEDWWFNKEPQERPTHHLLDSYKERRAPNLVKLSMIASLAESDELVIERRHFEDAHRLLRHAENYMPRVFQEMTTSPDKRHILELHNWAFKASEKTTDGLISEEELMRQISSRVDAHRAKYFLNILIDSGRVKLAGPNNPGFRKFKPVEVIE